MEDSRIWFYAVMIFIAFVSWLRRRIKEVAEARNERGRSQNNQRQDEDRRRQESSQSTAQQSSPAPARPSSLKELFEQVAAEQAQAQAQQQQTQQRQVQRQAAPPPLPVSEREKSFHQSEAAFHQQHEATTVHEQTVPLRLIPRRKKKAHHPSNRTQIAIRSAFSDRRKIRDAFILKEILDTPKGL